VFDKTGADRHKNTSASGSLAMTIRWMAPYVPLLAGAAADDRTALERQTLFFCASGTVVRLIHPIALYLTIL